jgi:asparagine synthase (glutamine-hydrolysing)
MLSSVEPLPYPTIRERPGLRKRQIELLRSGHLQYRMESWAAHGADFGLAYEYPLLDRRIIEFALSIPDHLYFKHGWKRWLYRTATEGVLPDSVRWNPHKFDMAMLAGMRSLDAEIGAGYRARLESRRDNPYVDVDRIIDQQGRTSQPDVGSAAFLAFVEIPPPR